MNKLLDNMLDIVPNQILIRQHNEQILELKQSLLDLEGQLNSLIKETNGSYCESINQFLGMLNVINAAVAEGKYKELEEYLKETHNDVDVIVATCDMIQNKWVELYGVKDGDEYEE